MVMGSYAVMANGFSAQSLALALPVGLMVAGILYYQSLPEIETDLAAGKRTLAFYWSFIVSVFSKGAGDIREVTFGPAGSSGGRCFSGC